MKVLFLTSKLSGYMTSCVKALGNEPETQITIIHWPQSELAPFEISLGEHIRSLPKNKFSSFKKFKNFSLEYAPNIVIMSGWMDKDYLKIGKILKQKGTMVIAGSDTQIKYSFRQFIGKIYFRFVLNKSISKFWVSGELQRQLILRLGAKPENIFEGYYACDWDLFNDKKPKSNNTQFLFIGRLIERKGIKDLLEAYTIYSKSVHKPWSLKIIGNGPEEKIITKDSKIIHERFIQPNLLIDHMKKASCFILPSHYEPWGVVCQEASALSLPLILSKACGAGVHLLKDNVNGFSYATKNINQLAKCMIAMHNLPLKEREEMGIMSHQLSKQYTPKAWVKNLKSQIQKNL